MPKSTTVGTMRVDVLSKEYPPEVYGGAGVHVAELVRALRSRDGVEARVHAFGAPARRAAHVVVRRPGGAGRAPTRRCAPSASTSRSPTPAPAPTSSTPTPGTPTWPATWPALLHGVPHVVSAHSLEPLRPWKAEQLGGGYAVSSWAERTAYEGAAAVIAVSAAMRDDVLRCYPALDPARVHVVHNGIDTDDWAPVDDPDRVRELGVDPDRPSVVFVGRITRQKGLPLFLRACAALPPDVQIVLCAGAPDTPEIEAEVEGAGRRRWPRDRSGVVWIREMLPRRDVVTLLTAATVFACPSIYEPLGIVNLEAMACETAVVATATGGIPEVVVDGETGLLVPIEQADDGTGTPLDPDGYVAAFAEALTAVCRPDRAAAMGRAGRRASDATRSAGRRSPSARWGCTTR